MRFTDKRVIVTGAAGAVGSGIVTAFAREGARILLSDPRTAHAESLVRRLDLPPDYYLIHGTDVRSAASIADALALIQAAWGGVDILVNNAGIYPDLMLLETSESDWDRVFAINLKGPFLLAQAVARIFIDQGIPGKIVNISSSAAETTRPGAAPYSCSKAGLSMLTRGLALELAPYNIRVNSVAPGLTQTDNEVNPLSLTYLDALLATIPLGRLCQPSDTAAAVLFVCSDEASFITGSTIKVDGGRSAGSFKLPRMSDQ